MKTKSPDNYAGFDSGYFIVAINPMDGNVETLRDTGRFDSREKAENHLRYQDSHIIDLFTVKRFNEIRELLKDDARWVIFYRDPSTECKRFIKTINRFGNYRYVSFDEATTFKNERVARMVIEMLNPLGFDSDGCYDAESVNRQYTIQIHKRLGDSARAVLVDAVIDIPREITSADLGDLARIINETKNTMAEDRVWGIKLEPIKD